MENELARQKRDLAVSTEILAKRADFFSYDTFSPLCRAGIFKRSFKTKDDVKQTIKST